MFKKITTSLKRIFSLKSKPKTVYLAGPMEHCSDNGLNWRLDYKKDLKKLNFKCIIPNFEEEEIISNTKSFKQDKIFRIDKYVQVMRNIIKKDLEFVENADLIITRWEGERMSGTIGEAQHAYLLGRKNYLVTSLSYHKVPGWFLACFTKLFHTKEELLRFLKSEQKKV